MLVSVFDHLEHLFLLILEVLLSPFFFQLDLLLLRQTCPLILELLFLFPLFRNLQSFPFFVIFGLFNLLNFAPHPFSLNLISCRQMESGYAINDLENCLENFEGILMFFVGRADLDIGSQEHLVFVVHLLVSNV
jgi:hypothetical protein